MRRFLLQVDWLTIVPIVLLTIMGTITLISFNINNVTSVTQGLMIKHILSILVGFVVAIIIAKIDYRSFAKLNQSLFFAIISLLTIVLILGDKINGARSWFSIGFFNLQPAEFAKFVIILIVAYYFSRYHYKLSSFISIILSLLPVSLIVCLILLQPDFGTASILIFIWLGMLIFGGVKLRHILTLFLMGGGFFLLLWEVVFKEYQKQRVLTLLNPTADPLGSGYNTIQAIKSISAGGVNGIQNQLIIVPEVHTDFIFAGFLQQWGFLGASFYFILILFIIGRLVYVGINIQDSFPKMIVLGVTICILIQTTINIGMNIGLLPITGVPLPFMSYGGSSMLVYWMLIGLILSVQNHQLSKGTIFMKEDQDIFN